MNVRKRKNEDRRAVGVLHKIFIDRCCWCLNSALMLDTWHTFSISFISNLNGITAHPNRTSCVSSNDNSELILVFRQKIESIRQIVFSLRGVD